LTDKHIMFIHYVIWLLQIFVTRGGNKKYASVLAPGQLDGLKYDFLLYSFLIGIMILFSVFMQVTCNLIINHICNLYLSLLFATRICQIFYFSHSKYFEIFYILWKTILPSMLSSVCTTMSAPCIYVVASVASCSNALPICHTWLILLCSYVLHFYL